MPTIKSFIPLIIFSTEYSIQPQWQQTCLTGMGTDGTHVPREALFHPVPLPGKNKH